jgi:hypothetical protein
VCVCVCEVAYTLRKAIKLNWLKEETKKKETGKEEED